MKEYIDKFLSLEILGYNVAVLSAPVTRFMCYHSSCFFLCPHIHSQLLFYYLFLYFLPPRTLFPVTYVNLCALPIAVACSYPGPVDYGRNDLQLSELEYSQFL